MVLLAGFEALLRERKYEDRSSIHEAISKWMKKKRQSVEVFRGLRTAFIEKHDVLRDNKDREDLAAPATLDDIANSLADLAWELDHPRSAEPGDDDSGAHVGEVSDRGDHDQRVHVELAALRRDIIREIRGEIMDAVKASIRDALSSFEPRLIEAEGKVDALQHQSEAQDAEMHALRKRISKLESDLEDQVEKAEIERRSCNVVIEGLPVSEPGANPEKEVRKLLRDTLGLAEKIEKPRRILRLRSHAHAHQPVSRVIVTLMSSDDRTTLLRNCNRLKDHPHIRVWEDLTPRQQARRRAQMAAYRDLRKAKKRAWFRGDRLFTIDKEGDPPRIVQPTRLT